LNFAFPPPVDHCAQECLFVASLCIHSIKWKKLKMVLTYSANESRPNKGEQQISLKWFLVENKPSGWAMLEKKKTFFACFSKHFPWTVSKEVLCHSSPGKRKHGTIGESIR
jgi:hypothetical protein